MSKEEFKYHDNIDRDVIQVGRDSLLLLMKGCREYFAAEPAAWGYAGMAASLLVPAFLAEGFKNLLSVPGETVRAIIIVLGIVMLGFSGYYTRRWYLGRGEHDPDKIINRLLTKGMTTPPLMLPAPSTPHADLAQPTSTKRSKIHSKQSARYEGR
jgi:hypothetical protein